MAADESVEIVVLTALPLEYAAVRAHLTGLRRRSHPLGTQFEIGATSAGFGWVAIVEIGEGNVDAALLASQAIDTFRPRAVFFVGVAGALRDDLALGDVVVATRVYAYHGGKEEGTEFLARPRSFEADHELEQRARYVSRAFQGRPDAPNVYFQPVAAGEIVLDSRGSAHARRLREHYGDAAAVEMESAGMAQAALMSRTRVLTIRGISDHADGHKSLADSTGSQPAAARNAASFAFALIDDFLAATPAAVRFHEAAESPQPCWRAVGHLLEVVRSSARHRGRMILAVVVGVVAIAAVPVARMALRPDEPTSPGASGASGRVSASPSKSALAGPTLIPADLGELRAGPDCVEARNADMRDDASIVSTVCNGQPHQHFTAIATDAPAEFKLEFRDRDRCLVARTDTIVGIDDCESAEPWRFASMIAAWEGYGSWEIRYTGLNGDQCLTLPAGAKRLTMAKCERSPDTQQWWIKLP